VVTGQTIEQLINSAYEKPALQAMLGVTSSDDLGQIVAMLHDEARDEALDIDGEERSPGSYNTPHPTTHPYHVSNICLCGMFVPPYPPFPVGLRPPR
jgi:hypothetical protein